MHQGNVFGSWNSSRTGGDHDARNLLLVQVVRDRRRSACPDRMEEERHFVFFDEASGLLHRLGRRIAVIKADQIYLSSVDAALGVDLTDIGSLHARHRAHVRCRAAVRRRLADFYLRVRNAWSVRSLTLGHRAAQRGSCSDGRSAREETPSINPPTSFIHHVSSSSGSWDIG